MAWLRFRKALDDSNFQEILKLYGCTMEEVKSDTRVEPIAECRQACYYLLNRMGVTHSAAAHWLNQSDHTRSIRGVRRIEGFISSYKKEYKILEDIVNNIVRGHHKKP